MKEKEEDETLFTDNYLCVNSCQSSCNALMREERKTWTKKPKKARESRKTKLQQK